MISGRTKLIAHLGYPTESFKAPLIYNPYFERHGIECGRDAHGRRGGRLSAFLGLVFRLSNILGALVTMPHKVTTIGLLDEVSTAAAVAGACNAVRLDKDGRLIGDMFDGEGFARGIARKGRRLDGESALVVGSGGVGSAIAASLAGAGVARLALFDRDTGAVDRLAARLRSHYPSLAIATGSNDPSGFAIVVNATPLGMSPGDPLPMDTGRIDPSAVVGEVVMTQEITPFLAGARARGCAIQVGTDMLFEQIPAYLEFFGLRSATPEELRATSRLG